MHQQWQTLTTSLSLIRTFSHLRSLCITGGSSECRYFIPQTTPWANDSFSGQSTYRQQTLKALPVALVICSISHFRNWVPSCNNPGTWTQPTEYRHTLLECFELFAPAVHRLSTKIERLHCRLAQWCWRSNQLLPYLAWYMQSGRSQTLMDNGNPSRSR